MGREPWTAEEDEYLREIERGVNGQWPTYRQIASWLDADIHRRSVRSPSAVSRRYKKLQERHHTDPAMPTASTEPPPTR